MLAAFLAEDLPIDVFEAQFLKVWKNESGMMPEGLFSVLERLFYAVEEYSPFYQPGDETRYVNSEAHLRRVGAAILPQLEKYLRKHRSA